MDTGTARKRPWEDDSPVDDHIKRVDTTTAAGDRHAPQASQTPLQPHHSGFYSHSGDTASPRTLAPLHIPTCSTSSSATSLPPPPPLPPSRRLAPAAVPLSLPLAGTSGLARFRPRSQSLFDVFQRPNDTDQTGAEPKQSSTLPAVIGFSHSPRPFEISGPPSGLGTDQAGRLPGTAICCPSDCSGPACSNTRTLMHDVAAELIALDAKVRSLLQPDLAPDKEPTIFEFSSTGDALKWALDLVQWTNLKLRESAQLPVPNFSEGSPSHVGSPSTMRRGQPHHDRDGQFPQGGHQPGPPNEHFRFPYPPAVMDDGRRNAYSNDMGPMGTISPHHSASPSGSGFLPPQSPMQAPQPIRSGLLPSPSSMSFQIAPNLPPISSPSSSLQASAQTAHVQDLQHQISVKTLALQTLQREYDSLLQKLERQRTKCAALEKKFEVSDVEINGLTDEKERLQAQVQHLESQVEELQQSRDEARRQLVANGAQYMRIMEMANRLQAQSTEDKKRWAAEKADLEQRIHVLEEAMVTGATSERPSQDPTSDNVTSRLVASTLTPSSSAPASETINVLRAEVVRLRARAQVLEKALHTMRQESISIQAVAKQLAESGGKMERAADAAMK